MLINTYNQQGEKMGQMRLSKDIFCVKVNSDLVNQVVVAQLANRRQGTAHSKDRGEVRGGGKKPWRQKGTGRARHGSIRSPIWRGGGVTFGPRKERVYKNVIPKKMKRRALLMVLSGKAKNNLLVVLDELKISQVKTKAIAKILDNLPCKEQSILVALSAMDKNIILSTRNIPRVETIQVKDLNALDLLSFRYLLMSKEAIRVVEKTFLT